MAARVLIDLQTLQSDSRDRGIGNYTRGFADALLRRSDFEWHVLLSDALPDALAEARRWAADRIAPDRIHVLHGLRPTRGIGGPANHGRARAAEALYAGFIDALQVDLLHVPSAFDGWGDETVIDWTPLDRPVVRSATVYDLIPFEDPDQFLPNSTIRNWYYKRLAGLRRADLVLTISQYTREAACKWLDLPESRIVSVGSDVDAIFAPQTVSTDEELKLRDRYGISRKMIIHVGILEPRKNVETLIRAYAELEPSLRATHQIVLIGSTSPEQRQAILRLVLANGLPLGAVVLPGFVDNSDLAKLYSLARVTVMPSLNEGFGLPLLEAMRCGCPVLGSATTSIPEVVGSDEFLFDPLKPSSLAERLSRMLTDDAFWTSAADHAARQQARFSWDESAQRAAETFEAALGGPDTRPARSVSLDGFDVHALEPANYLVPIAALCGFPEPPEQDSTALVYPADTDRDLDALVEHGPAIFLDLTPPLASEDTSPTMVALAAKLPDVIGILRPVARSPSPDAPSMDSPPGAVGLSPNRPGRDAVAWEFTLNGWPRSFRAKPAPTTFARIGQALGYASAIHPAARALGPLKRLSRDQSRDLSEADYDEISLALADNHAPIRDERRLLVDITELAQRDARSGIQRVVRNVLAALRAGSSEFLVQPVWRDGIQYRYAHRFGTGPDSIISDTLLDFRPTDTFLALDFDAAIPQASVETLLNQHLRGVRFIHVLYDVLPILRPDWFVQGMSPAYEHWLHGVARLTDGIACISQAVADDLAQVIKERRFASGREISIGSFHLGANLDGFTRAAVSSRDRPVGVDDVDMRLARASGSFILTAVGTIEPRKGYRQLLDAADVLWRDGVAIAVVIVGKRGWMVDDLVDRIENHTEFGKRLHWFEAIDDAALREVYESSNGVILPSEAEGFGLPLIEASYFAVPILARDLPVFREVGKSGATYFRAKDGAELADHIAAWIGALKEGNAPLPRDIRALTWDESAEQLLAFVRTVQHAP